MAHRRVRAYAVLLAAGIVLSGCAVFTGEGTAAGDLVVGRDPSQVDGKPVTVVVPSGHLVVRTGTPVSKVADDDTAGLKGRSGPDGGGFVPIAWTFDSADIPDPAVALAGDLEPIEVSLRVGSTTYAVGSPYTVSADGSSTTASAHNTFYVAVPDTTAPMSVVVGYDGVDQTADTATGKLDAGVAAPYYEGKPPSVGHCSDLGWRSTRQFHLRMPCRIGDPVVTPYAASSGWADPGHVYYRFAVDTTPYDITWRGQSGAGLSAQRSVDLSTLGGRSPLARTAMDPVSSASGSLADSLLFDVDLSSVPSTLAVGRRVTIQSPRGGAPTSFVARQRLAVTG